ncbi:MAG: hypothetical protein WBW01_05705, partial [Terriglobales bacterium]
PEPHSSLSGDSSGEDQLDLPWRHPPPLESSFCEPTPQSQDRTKKVVLTIVHEKAGRAQLQIHRVIG